MKMKYVLFSVELTNIFKKWKPLLTSVADIPVVVDSCPWQSSLVRSVFSTSALCCASLSVCGGVPAGKGAEGHCRYREPWAPCGARDTL